MKDRAAPSRIGGGALAWLAGRHRLHLLVVLGVCALVYWPALGVWGLQASEGHRVIPGWEALDSGELLPTRMFGLAYVRKPPGMPWAVAAYSSVLGETEFAARAVAATCATLMAVAAFFYARRWFGARWGLAAGLAQALTPRFWSHGRTAEIESMNTLATQLSLFLLVEMLVTERGRRLGLRLGALAATAIFMTGLAKGPASLPVIIAAPLAACLAMRSWAPLRRPALWGALAAGGAAFGLLVWAIARSVRGEPTVTQSVGAFVWNTDHLSRLWSFAPMVFIGALPASLALLFPFGPDAAREGTIGEGAEARMDEGFLVARTLAWTFVLAVGLLMLAMVSNPRYGVPAMVAAPPLVAYVLRGCASNFTDARKRIARAMLLGAPWVWVVALLMGAGLWIGVLEPRNGRTSGREPAHRLADLLPDGAVIWANGIIDARPELLMYARRDAAAAGRRVTPLWKQRELTHTELPPAGTYLLLNPAEEAMYGRAGLAGRLRKIGEGAFYKFEFGLWRVAPPDQNG